MSLINPPPPPPPSDYGSLLALFSKDIRDRYYKNETINLDGYSFTNCCFHQCVLVTNTGTFSLTSCVFLNCNMRYGPTATRILRLWNLNVSNNPWPFFNPKLNPDGSFTIE